MVLDKSYECPTVLQPADLYEFAAAYFAQQLQQAREQGLQPNAPTRTSVVDVGAAGKSLTAMYEQLFKKFQQQAAKGSGITALQACEVKHPKHCL